MSLEEYFTITRVIHSELAQIAEATGNIARAGTCNPHNSQFTQLMARHAALVRKFEQVHAKFSANSPHYIAND